MDPSQNRNRNSQQSTRTTASSKSDGSTYSLPEYYTETRTRNQPVAPQQPAGAFGPPGEPGTTPRPSSSGRDRASVQGIAPTSRPTSLATLSGTQTLQAGQSPRSSRTSGSSFLSKASRPESNGLWDPAQKRKDAEAARAIQEEAERRRIQDEAERRLIQQELERQRIKYFKDRDAWEEAKEKEKETDSALRATLASGSSSLSARGTAVRTRPEDRGNKPQD